MAKKTTKSDVALTPRKVKFNVKATPVVRKARTDLLNAVVACKGREADLDGLADTLEVVADFLKERGKRDIENRKAASKAAVAAAIEKQKLLDNQRVVTAKHDVAQADKGLAAAKEKLAEIEGRQKAQKAAK